MTTVDYPAGAADFMPESVGRGERRRTTPERRRRVSPWASIAVFLAAGVAARVRASAPAPVVVLLWPEEAHSFRNGTGIIAALVTKNFDPPREGSIELLLNGANAANFTPEAADGEGNRRLHVVLPDLTDGVFSVEVRCLSVAGEVLARHGATFDVNSSAPIRESTASTLHQSGGCHAVGFCDSDAECSGHGTCLAGACLCRGDWAGETCEHDIYNNPVFLPDSDPARSPSLCHRSTPWEQAAQQVHGDLVRLHRLQHCVVLAPQPPLPVPIVCVERRQGRELVRI